MRYFATSLTESTHPLFSDGTLGLMNTPQSGYRLDQFGPGLVWAADNGCFSDSWREESWVRFLTRTAPFVASCLWATVPDVVGDYRQTLDRFHHYVPTVRELGFRVAFVGQDGQDLATVPWDDFDCLFVGGTTEWKLRGSVELSREAQRRGKVTHMGRVNSLRRFRLARDLGFDSVDGTFLAYGPDQNLPRLLSWLADGQDSLFTGGV